MAWNWLLSIMVMSAKVWKSLCGKEMVMKMLIVMAMVASLI